MTNITMSQKEIDTQRTVFLFPKKSDHLAWFFVGGHAFDAIGICGFTRQIIASNICLLFESIKLCEQCFTDLFLVVTIQDGKNRLHFFFEIL